MVLVARMGQVTEQLRRAEGPGRIARFVAVGLVSTAAYFAVMILGVEGGGLGPVASSVLAFAAGTAVSFWLNTAITFGASATAGRLWRFLAVVTAGLVLNVAIVAVLERLGAHYLVSATLVFVVVPAFNYVAHARFTYAESGE